MIPRIAVIGCGPTGLYSLRVLAASDLPLSVTIYEAEAEPGKGTPYHPDINDPAMLSNIPSVELPALTETLVEWLRRQDSQDLARYGIAREAIDEREFYPRVVLGEFLRAQFLRIISIGRQNGHHIEVLERHRVTDIALQRDDIRLTVARDDGSHLNAVFDHVVMATGHNWPEKTEIAPGYFVSPWPAPALSTIGAAKVGILGTSLSAIDALMTVATANGAFYFDAGGELQYHPADFSVGFHATMMSRKGLLPEADFYCPLPYQTPNVCTKEAVDALIDSGRHGLLDKVFDLFRQELLAADPEYASRIGLSELDVESFATAYYAEREASDPFVWAAKNLAEATYNRERRHTVAWRYAILIMHEIVARVVPHLDDTDLNRFHRFFKGVFVDDYATVPLMSIRRLLALHRAGKLDIIKLGSDYEIARERLPRGAAVTVADERYVFEAFIDATGQASLSATDLPFPSLVAQGGVRLSQTPKAGAMLADDGSVETVRTGGIDVDELYRPRLDQPLCNRLYCAAISFLLHKQPFVQGITSACEIGEKVARALLADVAGEEKPRLFQLQA
jgi:uncharacterized NAD(P)/FAD-binding protein YdhS